MANVTAQTGKVTLRSSQRTLETWLLRSEQFRINTTLGSLAFRDGWDAFYNPGDPDSYTLVGTKISALSDLLGNWPDATQSTDNNRPTLDTATYAIPTALFAGNQRLQTASLPNAPISQPFAFSTATLHNGGAAVTSRFIGLDGGSNFVELTKGASAYAINAGSNVFAAPTSLTGLTPIAATFDGASSRLRVDANNTSGDAGAYAMTQITIGSRSNSYSAAATGIVGAVAVRLDGDDDAAWRMAEAIYNALNDAL